MHSPVQKRRAYSEKETQLILQYFSDHIARGDRASLKECLKFLSINPMDRNIQDKVKSLVKSCQT